MRAARFTSFLFVFAMSVAAQTNTAAASATAAYVYVGESTTPGKIAAFAVQNNGSVGVVSGSPFAGPSRNLAVNSGFVFGTDGTNIASFARNGDGGLRPIVEIDGTAHNDTLVGSGVSTITLDRSGSSLYAGEINFDGAHNNAYAEFEVQRDGSLRFDRNTGIGVDYGSPLQFSENNQSAYGKGCRLGGWDLFSFHRETNGELTSFSLNSQIPPNSNNGFVCASGLAVSAKGYLAVSYGVDSTGSKQNIAVYRISTAGYLELVPNSIVETAFTGIGEMRFDPTGSYLAVAGQKGIETFSLNSSGTLASVGDVLEPSVSFVGVKWDNAGHVYAISNAALFLFTLQNGAVTTTGTPQVLTNATSLVVVSMQ